jgi:hypothetical protein
VKGCRVRIFGPHVYEHVAFLKVWHVIEQTTLLWLWHASYTGRAQMNANISHESYKKDHLQNLSVDEVIILNWILKKYVGVSKSSQTSSTDRQRMVLHECVRCAREQGMSPLSVPSGVAV